MAQQAWYKRYEEVRDEALRYMEALRHIKQDSLQKHEIHSFARYSDITLIFESNTIEKAGTKTKGETREIIEKYFPRIPNDFRHFQVLDDNSPLLFSKQDLHDIKSVIEYYWRKDLKPSISFHNKSRPIDEVIKHYETILMMREIVLNFQIHGFVKKLRKMEITLAEDDNRVAQIKEIIHSLTGGQNQISATIQFLNENDILTLHGILANDLLPENADVEAGNYRIHDTEVVGVDVKFPAPELVPAAMTKFIENSNTRVEQVLSGQWNEFIMVAAEVSYNFVRIHPFPDFNGRMSRLLLAMTLRAFGVPFNLALRGSVAKYRNRYFYALKRANHGDLKPYATLIAMRLVESFREIDENLRLAGQKTLLE